MIIDLRAIGYDDNFEYDGCGKKAVAILEVDRIQIPLCMECINELTQQIEDFNNTIFCYKCKEFIKSNDYDYSGSCKLCARNNNYELKQKDAGYIFSRNYMDTCKNAILKD